MIYGSPYPRVDVPEETFHENVLKNYEKLGSLEAFIENDTGRSYSYQQIKKYSHRLGSALVRQGLKRGDVVLIFSSNNIEYSVIVFGVMSVGGIITTANYLYNPAELLYQLNDAKPKFIVCIPENYRQAQEAAKCYGLLKKLIVIGNGKFEDCLMYTDLIKDDGKAFPTNIVWNVREDVAAIFYSSGTTGLSKGVMLTHYNLVACLAGYRHIITNIYNEDDDLQQTFSLLVLPMYHLGGFVSTFIISCLRKTSVVVFSHFDFETFLKSIEKYKPVSLTVPPAVLLRIVKSPLTDKYDLSSLQFVASSTAKASAELEEEVKKKLNLSFVKQAYGLTESTGVGTYVPLDCDKLGSVGYPSPNVDMKIVDVTTDKSLGPGKNGEICLRGPVIMKGYLNNPQATAEILDDQGWLSTGDIGYVDEDGCLFIEDRLKDMIKYKGYQVTPGELESLLLTHPYVEDAAVIGLPAGDIGELPKAYIVRKNINLSEKDIIDFINGQVAPHKRLRGGVEFIKEIPRNNTGKVLRRVLKELAIHANKSKL